MLNKLAVLFAILTLFITLLRGDLIGFGIMLLVFAYLIHNGHIRIERK